MVINATNEHGALHWVVAISASAGGVKGLSNLVAGLSPDVPCAHVMVLHVPADARLRRLQEKAKLARQLADNTGPGLLFRRYSALAEESERALSVLSDRLSTSGPRPGGPRWMIFGRLSVWT